MTESDAWHFMIIILFRSVSPCNTTNTYTPIYVLAHLLDYISINYVLTRQNPIQSVRISPCLGGARTHG